MDSFLILVTWMALGGVTALKYGPAGSWPIAIVFGPLWLPVALELSRPVLTDGDATDRLRHLGFVAEGDV